LIFASARACFTRAYAALHKVGLKLFEFRTRDFHFQVLWPIRVGGDVWQANGRFEDARKLDFRLLSRLGQPLERLAIPSQIDTLLARKLLGNPVDEAFIEIVAAKVGVPRNRTDFEHTISHVQNRDIECSAAEVEYHDDFILFLVETVGERSGDWFVDDPQNVQPVRSCRRLW
jgi:hypothetical protein